MDHRRNFGTPSSQVVEREPLNPNLYTKVGTRVGVITAYYEYVTPTTLAPTTTSPSVPSIRVPVINTTPALCEQTAPIPPLYDTPKLLHEPSSCVLPPNHRP